VFAAFRAFFVIVLNDGNSERFLVHLQFREMTKSAFPILAQDKHGQNVNNSKKKSETDLLTGLFPQKYKKVSHEDSLPFQKMGKNLHAKVPSLLN
jgi:hypothetical protein